MGSFPGCVNGVSGGWPNSLSELERRPSDCFGDTDEGGPSAGRPTRGVRRPFRAEASAKAALGGAVRAFAAAHRSRDVARARSLIRVLGMVADTRASAPNVQRTETINNECLRLILQPKVQTAANRFYVFRAWRGAPAMQYF